MNSMHFPWYLEHFTCKFPPQDSKISRRVNYSDIWERYFNIQQATVSLLPNDSCCQRHSWIKQHELTETGQPTCSVLLHIFRNLSGENFMFWMSKLFLMVFWRKSESVSVNFISLCRWLTQFGRRLGNLIYNNNTFFIVSIFKCE